MNPTIVLGDFNSEWLQQGSVINELAKKSRFSTFQPKNRPGRGVDTATRR